MMLIEEYTQIKEELVKELPEGKSLSELAQALRTANRLLGGKLVTHVKSGGVYEIYGVEIGNREGKSFFDIRYHKAELEGETIYIERDVPFNRPCSEFLDGRFQHYLGTNSN